MWWQQMTDRQMERQTTDIYVELSFAETTKITSQKHKYFTWQQVHHIKQIYFTIDHMRRREAYKTPVEIE